MDFDPRTPVVVRCISLPLGMRQWRGWCFDWPVAGTTVGGDYTLERVKVSVVSVDVTWWRVDRPVSPLQGRGGGVATGVNCGVLWSEDPASAFLSGVGGCVDFAGDVAVGVASPAVLAGDVTVGVASPDVAGAASLADLTVVVTMAPLAVAGVASPAVAGVAPRPLLGRRPGRCWVASLAIAGVASPVVAGVASLTDLDGGVTIGAASLADAGVVSLADVGVASLADAGDDVPDQCCGCVPGRPGWQCCRRSDRLGCTGLCGDR